MSAAPIAYEMTLTQMVTSEIKADMGRFDLRQADLAKVLGVTQPQASRKLRGITPFTLEEIEVISSWFGTTPQVLMGFATEPRAKRPVDKEYTARDSNPEPTDLGIVA